MITHDILIKNNYYIVDNNYSDKFHIALYYLDYNKCKVIIRRLDCIGWVQDLKIKINDIDNNYFEKISLGSSDENLKILDIYTKILLYKCNYNIDQKIPKIIIQTNNNDINLYQYNAIMSLIELNPEYEYKVFNEEECREFIINNSKNNIFESIKDNIENTYDLLLLNNIKSDFFIYFYLYINGGCYIDSKMIIKKSLNSLIKPNDDIMLCNYENINNIYYNGFIFICKENKYLLRCIKNIILHTLKFNKGDSPFFLTKNQISENNFPNINKTFIKSDTNIYFYNEQDRSEKNIIFYTKYKNYNNLDYKIMWENNEYFYKEFIIISNFKFLFYPNKYNDKFTIILLKDNLFLIKRIDSNEGWAQFIKLKVINLINHSIYKISIGDSYNNEKIFAIQY